MKSFSKIRMAVLAGTLGLLSASAYAGPLGYTLDVTTHYQFGTPAGAMTPFGGGSPDSGTFTVTNNGTTTFTGMVSDVAVSNFSGDYSFATGALTLNPGDSVSIMVNAESSNQGGYNGPFGTVQPGVIVKIDGLINGTEAVDLAVADADIHSGVPRVNPFGLLVDSYVLQGGEPLGRDTGDDFEVTQADGHFRFFEEGSAVPSPAAVWGGLSLLGGLGVFRRIRRPA
jgi:hypothetical protein